MRGVLVLAVVSMVGCKAKEEPENGLAPVAQELAAPKKKPVEVAFLVATPVSAPSPIPPRFAAPIPHRATAKIASFPPETFIAESIASNTHGMRERLVVAVRLAAATGTVDNDLANWYTRLAGYSPSAELCTWVVNIATGTEPPAVRGVFWRFTEYCEDKSFAEKASGTEVPDDIVLHTYATMKKRMPFHPRVASAAIGMAKQRTPHHPLDVIGSAFANMTGPEVRPAFDAVLKKMPAHKRDAIAANLTASQDPELRALGIAACTRLTEDEAECKKGADAEALLRTADDPTTAMANDALANCARTQERTKAVECLVTLALRDRVAAVAIAKTSDRTPDDHYTNVAKALVTYPASGAVEKYLASLGVTPSKKGAITPSVTLYDAFVEYGRVDHFDTETGSVPNEHDALLARLAKLATPALDGAVFEEIAPKNDVGPYSLRAYMDDKRYTLEAKNNGDWYDMEAVIGLLNALAIERKSDMRFVVLPTHDQTALVLAAPALALGQMVADGAIQIEDANAAMKDGKAFEDQVLHELGGGGGVQ